MTTARTTGTREDFRLPDPPPREPDDMTSFDHLARTGAAYLLAEHLGSADTTLVAGEHYIAAVPTGDMTGVKYPGLLVAFDVDPAAYHSSNAYVISEQGKPRAIAFSGCALHAVAKVRISGMKQGCFILATQGLQDFACPSG